MIILILHEPYKSCSTDVILTTFSTSSRPQIQKQPLWLSEGSKFLLGVPVCPRMVCGQRGVLESGIHPETGHQSGMKQKDIWLHHKKNPPEWIRGCWGWWAAWNWSYWRHQYYWHPSHVVICNPGAIRHTRFRFMNGSLFHTHTHTQPNWTQSEHLQFQNASRNIWWLTYHERHHSVCTQEQPDTYPALLTLTWTTWQTLSKSRPILIFVFVLRKVFWKDLKGDVVPKRFQDRCWSPKRRKLSRKHIRV